MHPGLGSLERGTIVELEKLDKWNWRTEASLERNLLPHFGVTYRNFLRTVSIWVNHKRVEPVDPLFLTPGSRLYALDDDRAVGLPPLSFEMKDNNGAAHAIRARFAYFPPTFHRLKKDQGSGTGNMNDRFPIMRDYHGIIVLRNGRQIDIVSRFPDKWPSFRGRDRMWNVELDVSAGLDDELSITTSKQQVNLSERMWQALEQAGVKAAIEKMRRDTYRDSSADKVRRETAGRARASELAMKEAERFKRRKPAGEPAEQRAKAEEALRREVERRSKESGVPSADVEAHLQATAIESPYKVWEEMLPGAPFFRVEQVGGLKALFINKAHRFYADVYSSADSTLRSRAALEVLLFVIGECELDATSDRRLFYETERGAWSEGLSIALDRLALVDDEVDAESAEDGDDPDVA